MNSLISKLRAMQGEEVLAIAADRSRSNGERLSAISLIHSLVVDEELKCHTLQSLAHECDESIATWAINELAKVASDAALKILREIADDCADIGRAASAISSLAAAGENSVTDRCGALLPLAKGIVACRLARALGRVRTAESMDLLVQGFATAADGDKLYFALELARRHNQDAEEYLRARIQTEEDQIKLLMCASALTNVQSEVGHDTLADLLRRWPEAELFSFVHILQQFSSFQLSGTTEPRSQVEAWLNNRRSQH